MWRNHKVLTWFPNVLHKHKIIINLQFILIQFIYYMIHTWLVTLRVPSHWASNFASASASASNSQTQTQSSSLNCVSNPFHFNRKLSWKFSCKVNHDVSRSIWMVWYAIEWGTLRVHLRVTRRRKATRSMWTEFIDADTKLLAQCERTLILHDSHMAYNINNLHFNVKEH